MENQCAAQQSHRLQGQTLPHPLMPGSLPSPAQTNHLEFQVWDRGNSTGQFPADRALCWSLLSCGSCSRAVLGPYVSWSCQFPAEPVQAWWVQYFLAECPSKVSECATETVPVLGCRENLNSPSATALGLLCSPPSAGAKARSKVQVLHSRALPEDKRLGKSVT